MSVNPATVLASHALYLYMAGYCEEREGKCRSRDIIYNVHTHTYIAGMGSVVVNNQEVRQKRDASVSSCRRTPDIAAMLEQE